MAESGDRWPGRLVLNVWQARDLSADEALAAAVPRMSGGPEEVAAFVSGTRSHFAARVRHDGKLERPDGVSTLEDLETRAGRVWGLQAFGGPAELRWRQAPEGRRAVLLVEAEAGASQRAPQGEGWDAGDPLTELDPLDGEYMLWGEVLKGAPAGWLRLGAGRVGAHDIPFAKDQAGAKRVALRAREYLYRARERDGNVTVVEERLIGFVTVRERGGNA